MGSQLMASAADWDQISSGFIGPIWYLLLYKNGRLMLLLA